MEGWGEQRIMPWERENTSCWHSKGQDQEN